MTDEEIPKQLQDQIARLQQMRVQLQMIVQQRQQTEIKLKEIGDALEELDKTDEKTPIYKSVGAILIKTKNKADIIKELKFLYLMLQTLQIQLKMQKLKLGIEEQKVKL